MPISVTCACGQSLKVPDAMAGKTGRCPKCQQIIKIPGAPVAAPQATAARPAPTAQRPPQSAPAPKGGIHDLLDEAGVGKQKGPVCPRCETAIKPGAVLCVKCGMNFQTGELVAGHKVELGEHYGNMYLDEAVANMKRDDVMEDRQNKAGLPWWVLLIILVTVLLVGGAGIAIVDSRLVGPQPEDTLIGKIQKIPLGSVFAFVLLIAGALIGNIGTLIILIHAFRNRVLEGVMCLFVPFYILIYMFRYFSDLRSAFTAIMISWVIGTIAGIILGMS